MARIVAPWYGAVYLRPVPERSAETAVSGPPQPSSNLTRPRVDTVRRACLTEPDGIARFARMKALGTEVGSISDNVVHWLQKRGQPMEALAMVVTVGVTTGVGVLAGSIAVNGALRLVRRMTRPAGAE